MRRVITCTLLIALLLSFSSCSSLFVRREKSGSMEFVYNDEADAYTLVYYTDTSAAKELVIPGTFKEKPVTAIGQLAIGSCDTLEKIVIGENIGSIDKWGIVDCRYLRRIEVAEGNAHFKSVDGALYSRDGARLITYPNAHSAQYADDGKLLQKASYTVEPGTKIISHCAFYKCYGLEQVLLPDTVEVIEERAFHKCDSMGSVNFPEGLTSIGKDAFLGCQALTEITLPSTIREIGEYAFYNAQNIQAVRIKAREADVALGNKWYPTSAGRDIASLEIVWGYDDGSD